jgi:hypothetical protein
MIYKMTTHLLLAGVLAGIATYCGTQPNHKNVKDEIMQIRTEVKEIEVKEQETEAKHEFSKYRTRTGNSYFVDKKRTTRESYVRRILEGMFQRKFPSIRPSWLVNPNTGRRLEIDCYCVEMRLGCEIQGEQHFSYIPYFHRNYQAFLDMKERDMIKRILIRKRGIKSVEIPYTVQDNDLEMFLLEKVNAVMK